jgi:hypothetical protein
MNTTTFTDTDRDTHLVNAFVTRLFQTAAATAAKPTQSASDIAKAFAEAFANR